MGRRPERRLRCRFAAGVALLRSLDARTLSAAGTSNRRRFHVERTVDDLRAMAAALRADMRRELSAVMERVVVDHDAPRNRNHTAKRDVAGNPLEYQVFVSITREAEPGTGVPERDTDYAGRG